MAGILLQIAGVILGGIAVRDYVFPKRTYTDKSFTKSVRKKPAAVGICSLVAGLLLQYIAVMIKSVS